MRIKKHIKFYMATIKFGIKLKVVYRMNFWLGFISDIVYYSVLLCTFLAIFNKIDVINGWNSYQIMFFLGTFFVIDSVAMVTYFLGVVGIPYKIRMGDLDLYLTKPMNPLFLVSAHRFEFSFAFNMLYGLTMLIYSWYHLHLQITALKIIGYITLLILMYILMFTIMVILASASFWFIRIDSLQSLHQELTHFISRVPGIAYRGIWRIFFLVVVPYGLIATVPTQFATAALKGKYWLITIGVSLAYWYLCLFIWNKGLKRYNSASS